MDKTLLEHAHAFIKGKYVINNSIPELKCYAKVLNLGFDHPAEKMDFVITGSDLEGLLLGTSIENPTSTLIDLGEFQFEAYWFNRKRLGPIDSIGNQKKVRDLQRLWSGILLFRDGFRVFPYGEDDDDWLGLDRRAFGSSGYLLNKTQFIGQVSISRLNNPYLIDQTNRQGLRVCPEQQVFIDVIRDTIQNRLRSFLKDIAKRYKTPHSKVSEIKTDISALEKRARVSFDQIRQIAPDSIQIIDYLENVFQKIRISFSQTESHLQQKLNDARIENRQLIQMAGVGLLVEVVAHELARSSENTLLTLRSINYQDIPDQLRGLFNTLQSEMSSVNKTLRILDPLSVSGRHRKEFFIINSLVEDILDSHRLQFLRHSIELILLLPQRKVSVYAVKGMIVQIIENLISNSIYWLGLRKNRESVIKISLATDPLTITYQDNGSGITRENQENVFRPFFSLKEKTKRRGLGLYIARECAEYHGGTLILDDEVNVETQRLHRFILELPY